MIVHRFGVEPPGGNRRGTDSDSTRHHRRPSLPRSSVLVDDESHLVECDFGLFAGEFGVRIAEVDKDEVFVRPAGHDDNPRS
ncbi:hypothetical protein GCM10025751_55150 [Haladaptatus pallidirubidus]|uniref:Uncharacterized protein n=1 Tax=Haladaptatus pallidirubidus TaxID=1008152 RepID=A0AAV3URF4_9EURY